MLNSPWSCHAVNLPVKLCELCALQQSIDGLVDNRLDDTAFSSASKYLLSLSGCASWHTARYRPQTSGLQAGKSPHCDVSAVEVERGTRRSEHLLYLQRRQRALLAALGAEHGRMARLATVLRSLGAGNGALPGQASSSRAGMPPPCLGHLVVHGVPATVNTARRRMTCRGFLRMCYRSLSGFDR